MSDGSLRFKIYEGNLSDAPGRWETWTEYLRQLGEDCWELETIDTDREMTAGVREIPG